MTCITAIISIWITACVALAVVLFIRGTLLSKKTAKAKQLGVWFDGWTLVVARSKTDAIAILSEYYEWDIPTTSLRQLSQRATLKLWIGDPDGPTIEKTVSDWAAGRGRGFLASTEY